MTTHTTLLDCAEIMVRKRGYDGFSYADLAGKVGIRKASIHHHFPTKADLAAALVQRYSDNVFESLDEVARSDRSAGEILTHYVAMYRGALADGDQLCLCVALCGNRESLAPSVLTALAEFHERSLIWLINLFARGTKDGSIAGVLRTDEEAHATIALVEGAQLLARALNDPNRFDRAVASLLARRGTH
jgi:TetR/AcrR family transcriptional regulator, transcriptional repressor for nem operon